MKLNVLILLSVASCTSNPVRRTIIGKEYTIPSAYTSTFIKDQPMPYGVCWYYVGEDMNDPYPRHFEDSCSKYKIGDVIKELK